jgi:glutamate dehydrogenase (NAD(P)+)
VEYPDAEGANGAEAITPEDLVALDCEVLIPAALGSAIDATNAGSVRAQMLIEGANNPTTPHADEILNESGVPVIPDVLANAGGAIVSYFEWAQNLQHFGWDEREVNDRLAARMRRAYGEVAERARAGRASMRVAAYELGISRVVEAGRLRRHRGYV